MIMQSKNEKIELDSTSVVGFFDSGIGGLTVLKEFISLSIAECIYVADTANMPYGNKTLEEIKKYSEEIVRFLLIQGATTIIISCHTATALGLEHLQKTFKNTHFIGVIDLVTLKAINATKNNRIGIIATQATIDSGAHKKAILDHNPHALVFEQACPLLASAVEFGTHQRQELDTLILKYIQPLLAENIDTLILGSTHYDVIKEVIKSLTPPTLRLISAHEQMRQQFTPTTLNVTNTHNVRYYITGDKNSFLHSSKKILAIKPPSVTKLTNVLQLMNKNHSNLTIV